LDEFGLRGHWDWRLRGEVFLRLRAEFLGAAGGTEAVGFSGVVSFGRGARWINRHPADWISFHHRPLSPECQRIAQSTKQESEQ
jgi:hypothetical protein